MTIGPRGFWVSIDGVESVGKTTLSVALGRLTGGIVAPEFSDAAFGLALRTVVKQRPHHISKSPIGQCLVFLGDFFEVHAESVAPKLSSGALVFSDRGYVSKYAYQRAVLEDSLGVSSDQFLDRILGLIAPPDLTIYLRAPLSEVERRLVARDGRCDSRRLDFIAVADEFALARLARTPTLTHVIIDGSLPSGVVVSAALAALGQHTSARDANHE